MLRRCLAGVAVALLASKWARRALRSRRAARAEAERAWVRNLASATARSANLHPFALHAAAGCMAFSSAPPGHTRVWVLHPAGILTCAAVTTWTDDAPCSWFDCECVGNAAAFLRWTLCTHGAWARADPAQTLSVLMHTRRALAWQAVAQGRPQALVDAINEQLAAALAAARREARAAAAIQRAWRACCADPAHPACRRRLAREFEELPAIL